MPTDLLEPTATDSTDLDRLRGSVETDLKRVAESGRPLVVEGVSSKRVVVVTEEEYDVLLDKAERLRSVEMIDESLRQVEAGQTRPAKQAIREIAERLGLPLPVGDAGKERTPA